MTGASLTPPRGMRSLIESIGSTRAQVALGAAIAAIVVLSLAFVIGNPDPGRAESTIKIETKEVAALKSLDEGEQAEIIIEGVTAQERNALIPESGLPVEAMGRFATIATGNASYSTALKCLTQAVYYEAANEPLQGKRGVAQVVLNRLRHPAYPNTVCGVVYEGVKPPGLPVQLHLRRFTVASAAGNAMAAIARCRCCCAGRDGRDISWIGNALSRGLRAAALGLYSGQDRENRRAYLLSIPGPRGFGAGLHSPLGGARGYSCSQ